MGVSPSLTAGEPMGVGQSPQKEAQAGRAKSSSKPPSRLRRATPTDKGLGGADRACVEDPNSSNLNAKASFWRKPESGFVITTSKLA